MNNESPPLALVLGGTGRTGSLLADRLARRGVTPRTAARSGAAVRFDWDDPATHRGALAGVDRLYLVTPTLRVRYAAQVAAFLDLAESEGVRHVSYLSVHHAEQAPAGVDIAAVEADLASRHGLTHTVLRAAWVMQNFVDGHIPLVDGVFTVPSGGGREAFVDAADIAAVAAETLLDPAGHAGAVYSLTGPQALTFDEAADTLASVSGQAVAYRDIDQETWISGALAAGVPAEYAVMLRWLTGSVITGHGATPTPDIEKVTGRPATTFRAFAERDAHAWTTITPEPK
ncbi:NmrA family NAD(P)-binding protein [Streptacidiphilus anmyonensis]|uniref:NmrA family NAD(P)-binding protein n=1 Tax=Streptacidiphilus anmyonensis TaxID=405782 RepID=UPI0005A903CD|nr:NmrA family NAD(P)-binding protein [Streptacidiphilus anmyonensis]